MQERKYIINDISLAVDSTVQQAISAASTRLSRAGVSLRGVDFSLYRRSVDARKKNDDWKYSGYDDGKFLAVETAIPSKTAKFMKINCQPVEEIETLIANNKDVFKKLNLKIPKFLKSSLLIIGAATAGVFVLSNLIGTKLQVRASRIARWQSREDLKDPKYFVQYTEEQIAQAQNNLEANKKENKKGFSFKGNLTPIGGGLLGAGLFGKKDEDKFEKRNKGFLKTLFSTIKDNKKYKEWAKSYNPQDKMVQRELSQQDLIEAQKDKEVIQRITKKINNNAEEYSEDMEVAAKVLIGGTPFLGLAVSSLLNLFINKTGIAKKGEEKAFNKALEGLDEAKQKNLKNIRKNFLETTENNKKDFIGKLKNLIASSEYCSEMLNASFVEKNGKLDITQSLSKAFNFLKSTKASRNILIGITGTALTTIAGAFIGLKLQKASALCTRE